MAPSSSSPPPSFHDLPEDLQIAVLSFLSPSDLHPFVATSRRSLSLCSHPALWRLLCLRRWSPHTRIPSWSPPSSRLYAALSSWSNLIGFWRQIAQTTSTLDYHHHHHAATALVLFEWGPSFVLGSRLSPSPNGSYYLTKVPFLWLGMDPTGRPVCFAHRRGHLSHSNLAQLSSRLDHKDPALVPLDISFVCGTHFVLDEEESCADGGDAFDEELATLESSSPPDRVMLEVYQYFANRTSPGSEKSSRKQRRRKERGRLARRTRKRLEPEHYVKIADCCPTSSRPLQGLWKGIGEDMKLGFYLVTYHRSGVISCQRVAEPLDFFAGANRPVFWTTDANFIEFPFPREEVDIYDSSFHIQPATSTGSCTDRAVTKILGIGSDYDSAIPVLTGSSSGFHNVEGRLWQYKGGAFGFGFLENGYIIDLIQVARNGQLLDVECYGEDTSRS